jgi:hypothetical protein
MISGCHLSEEDKIRERLVLAGYARGHCQQLWWVAETVKGSELAKYDLQS